jgi:hypothetical protein|tara:strand:- start:904 stop:1326 length:423 start_codon:yes stop_codon:yes gene_type:complete
MKVFILLFIISLSSIADLRMVYQSQDEDKVLNALKELETKSMLTADEQCYKAVFLCMKADYLTWPMEKLSAFKKGYADLNSIIDSNAHNAEYYYHRYMIEKHSPSWLLDVNHMTEDKAFVKANMKSSHPMYSFVTKTIDK